MHARLPVVDLHADSLLWRRDLLRRATSGHIDLPRLQEAGVTLQVLDAVTQVPVGLNFERNDTRGDLITLLAIAQGWPPRTWTSRLERARYAADRLHRFAERSDGALRVVRTAADLDALLAAREADPAWSARCSASRGARRSTGGWRTSTRCSTRASG